MPSVATAGRTAAIVLVVVGMMLSLCIGNSDLVGKKAPAFTVLDVDGSPHNLSDYRGRVLVLDFFATWCGPCAAQVEELKGARSQLDEGRVDFLQVDVDDAESEAKVRDFRDHHGLTWPVAYLGASVGERYGADAIPTIVVIDQGGDVRYHHIGVVKASKLKEVVDDLL